MTTGVELAPVREDAAQLAREGQTSFEGFATDIPWRSVSEGEGIAAAALLAWGQQESANRSSSSRGGDSSGANGRCDSSAWPFLIASGGEIAPPSAGGIDRFKSASSGDEAQGTTTNSNNSGDGSNNDGSSSYGGVEGSATEKPLELGPMPTAPPFGGYNQGLARSSSNGSRSRSGSRSGGSSRRSRGERRKTASGSRNSPTRGSMSLGASTSSIFDFFNDSNFSGSRSSSAGSPGDHSSAAAPAAAVVATATAGGGGSVGGIRSGPGEAPPSPWPYQQSHVPMREPSFDPYRKIDTDHKEMGVVPPWVPEEAHTAGIPGLGPAVRPTSRGNKFAEFPVCAPRPCTQITRHSGAAYPSNGHGGVCDDGGGGGENVRVEYPDRYFVQHSPSPSSSSFSSQSPSWRGASPGPGTALAQQPSRVDEELGDGRHRPHPGWVSAPAVRTMHPGAGSRAEGQIKPAPPSSDRNPGRVQMPPQLYPPLSSRNVPRRSRLENRETLKDNRHRVNKANEAAAAEAAAAKSAAAAEAAVATALAAAAASAASAHTALTPPTAAPRPPSPAPTASTPCPAAAADASRVQQHSPTRKVVASPPNNVYNLLAKMIPDLANMGGRSPAGTGTRATAEAPASGLSGTPQRSNPPSGAFSDASESTFPPPRLAATDASVGERMAMLGAAGCYGGGGDDGCLDEEEARKAQKKVSRVLLTAYSVCTAYLMHILG